jgi:hypothetical protein
MSALVALVGVLAVVTGAIVAWRRMTNREERIAVDLSLITDDEGVLAEPLIPDSAPAEAKEWPEPEAGPRLIPPPVLEREPSAPIPGEPPEVLFPQPRALVALTADRLMMDLEPAANPYEALRQRHDRITRQVEAAYAEVHRVRTESLRRASEAEHSAELAATARKRAERVKAEIGRYTNTGRHRSVEMPDAKDAFQDVHRFRVDALRRATEAERGAEAVSAARARAAELLKEQREIEAEMARLGDGF